MIGELITGDLAENTMTFEIEGDVALRAGRYEITRIEEEITEPIIEWKKEKVLVPVSERNGIKMYRYG